MLPLDPLAFRHRLSHAYAQADTYITINPSTGACPAANWLSETQCAALDGQVIDGKVVDYKGSGTWGTPQNPETCGCYFDTGAGDVYFNLKTVGCAGADAEEIPWRIADSETSSRRESAIRGWV